MKMFLIVFFLTLVGFSIIGCGSISDLTITKKTAIDGQITAARIETETKINNLKEEEKKILQETIIKHVEKEQAASDYLFKGSVVFGSLKLDDITRPTLIMGQSIQQTASQLPPATVTAQASVYKALQIELDEVKTTTAALKAQYELELSKARAEGEAKDKVLLELDTKVKTIEKEKTQVLAKSIVIEKDLQAKKDEVQDKSLALKTKEAEEAKNNENSKKWLMGTLLAAAFACGLGAAFLPIPQLKTKLIIGAAICGAAAVAIPFIQPWWIIVGVVICLIPVGAWMLKNYKDEHTVATNTYRAIQSVKERSKVQYDMLLKPALEEWHSKYTKKGVKVPDTAAHELIDKRLMEAGDK